MPFPQPAMPVAKLPAQPAGTACWGFFLEIKTEKSGNNILPSSRPSLFITKKQKTAIPPFPPGTAGVPQLLFATLFGGSPKERLLVVVLGGRMRPREHASSHVRMSLGGVRMSLRGLAGCLELVLSTTWCLVAQDISRHPPGVTSPPRAQRPVEDPVHRWPPRLHAGPGAFSFPVPVKVKPWRKNVAVCYRGREVKRAGNLHHVHFPLALGRCSFRIWDLRRQS